MVQNSVCLCVLVLISVFEIGHSNSPCPNIFGFFTDGKNVFGQITLKPVETLAELKIRISFTVQADLGDYLGRIVAPEDILDKYNRGETVIYRVYFPILKPPPKVTEIALNGQILCTGPGDKPTTRVISHPTLQLTNCYGVGVGPPPYKRFSHQESTTTPQTTPWPTPKPTPRPTPKPKMRPTPMTIPQRPIRQSASMPYAQGTQHTNKDYALAFVQNIINRYRSSDSEFCSNAIDAGPCNITETRYAYDSELGRCVAFQYGGCGGNQNNFPDKEYCYFYCQPLQASSPQYPFVVESQSRPEPQPTRKPALPPKQEYSRPATIKPQSRPDDRYTNECGVVAGGNEILELIYNGLSYDRGQIPWLVAIFKAKRNGLEFVCGGTLVSDRHVVTAAHCKQSRGTTTSNSDIVVKLGVHDLSDWEDELSITTKIINATMHESYNGFESLRSDIMVLTLSRRIKFNRYIRPACLWSGNTELERVVGATGVVAGWGDRGDRNSYLGEPQLVRIPIVSNKDCRASNAAFHSLTYDTTFCAGDRRGAGPCTGDSGGGLYLLEGGKWRLRGVVSLSLQSVNLSCNLNEYVICTDTAQYLPWIRNILSQKYYD